MNWTCPYCNREQTVTSANYAEGRFGFTMDDPDTGPIGLVGTAIRCANTDCHKAVVSAGIVTGFRYHNDYIVNVRDDAPTLSVHQLIPDSSAKPQPEYIPSSIREDYYEACKITKLSPKASATLSRRCLQSMIRDFAGIEGKTLYHEIEKLKELSEEGKEPRGVSLDSIDALHHMRSLGNIGAHMEKDIDLIIPVEPEEAQVLIGIIETLFDEWYVARHSRQTRFEQLKEIAEEKQSLRSPPTD